MNIMHGQYRVTFASPHGGRGRDLVSGRDFRMDEEGFSQGLSVYLRPLERDLLRLGMGMYTVDRLVRRIKRPTAKTHCRSVDVELEVSDPDFWNASSDLVARAVRQVSDDFVAIRFVQGQAAYVTPPLFPLAAYEPIVGLYSGGLDSAGGLARRLRDVSRPVVTVTACHQPGQRKRVKDQVAAFARHYGKAVLPLAVRTTMINPPLPKYQELSQRCRSFLFLSLGGAVASLAGSADVEVYESGVGAINLPPMAGMVSGGRATKGCHPQFLRLMSEIVSRVAKRRITFSLPFRTATKAEVVRVFAEDDLSQLAAETVSCVHYPLRERGEAKQCGVCMACVGRRQSLISGGVPERHERYKYDLFGSADEANAVPERDLVHLKAMLLQIADLDDLTDDGASPDLFRRHVFGTQLLGNNEPVAPWVAVMRRYRDEWRVLVDQAALSGISWAQWLPSSDLAA
jgi:7-cyano-7-deazaguanine synthase in queuosine biosynthesis